jgi:hypothetical protein
MQLIFAGGHAAFQAIMHVLSELRNPLFEAPDRERALRALQLSRLLRENNHTKPWEAIKSMIDKVAGENVVSHDAPSRPTNYSGPTESATLPTRTTSNPNPSIYSHRTSGYTPPPMISQSLPPQSMQQPMTPMQQGHTQFKWDDLNFSNIIGDTQPTAELPEFDFVSLALFDFGTWANRSQGFWGDPVNFGNEPLTYPEDGGYNMPWAS